MVFHVLPPTINPSLKAVMISLWIQPELMQQSIKHQHESLFGTLTCLRIYCLMFSFFLSSSSIVLFSSSFPPLTSCILLLIKQQTPASVHLHVSKTSPLDSCQVSVQSNLLCMTELLPVCASRCVYCLWVEMKRGSVARLGSEMLTRTAEGILPNTHTHTYTHTPEGTIKTKLQLHTLIPPTLLQRVMNLQEKDSVVFLGAWRDKPMSFSPSAHFISAL